MTLPPFRWSPRPTTTIRRLGGSLGSVPDRGKDHPDRAAQGAGEAGDGLGVRAANPAGTQGEQGALRDSGESGEVGEGAAALQDQSFE